eukprot:839350-Rhodomonas_salina.2
MHAATWFSPPFARYYAPAPARGEWLSALRLHVDVARPSFAFTALSRVRFRPHACAARVGSWVHVWGRGVQ